MLGWLIIVNLEGSDIRLEAWDWYVACGLPRPY